MMNLFDRIVSKVKIEKGWSGDKKYCAEDKEGRKFLLRISPIDQYERKKSEYDLMNQVAKLGVPMCLPLEFGICDEGVYSIQSWIDGVVAESQSSHLSYDEQYNYGLQAGKLLKKIHSVPAPDDIEDWADFFNRKIDRKIKAYNDCPLKYDK